MSNGLEQESDSHSNLIENICLIVRNMAGYTESLDDSLGLLYHHSLNYHVSVSLIQKLAQYLKLDTFIDTDVSLESTIKNLQRLSIAGSLLLVDLDFAGDSDPVKVSVSSGNHAPGDSETSRTLSEPIGDPGKCIVLVDEQGHASVVRVDFQRGNNVSFLNVRHENDTSVAEHILLSNLLGPTLGKFPANLQYLANLDSMSPPDGDLVVYVDNMALFLSSIHATEVRANPGNWQIEAGWGSRVGKVSLNDIEEGRLGVILLIWKENRYIERKIDASGGSAAGTVHKAVLSIKESAVPSIDYVKEASSSVWTLVDLVAGSKSFQFVFDDDLHLHNGQSVTSLATKNWALVLDLTTPVFIPTTVLDFLGLTDYKVVKDKDGAFNRLSECGVLEYEVDAQDIRISFVTEEIYQFVAIASIRLDSLIQISKLLPIIRNLLALTALVRNVSQTPGVVLCDAKTEFAEVNKKLKDSLKLASDVTDEELVGLTTMSEATDFMNGTMIGGTDLTSFIKQDLQDDMMREDSVKSDVSTPIASKGLKFVVEEILYDSADTEFLVSVHGKTESVEFSTKLEIANGEIREQKKSEDVDMDGHDSGQNEAKQFSHALALSEDPLLAYEIIK